MMIHTKWFKNADHDGNKGYLLSNECDEYDMYETA